MTMEQWLQRNELETVAGRHVEQPAPAEQSQAKVPACFGAFLGALRDDRGCDNCDLWHGCRALTADVAEAKQKQRASQPEPVAEAAEYTGGSVSYYRVPVAAPLSGGAPYVAECNDIIEALGMTYAEGNAFKAIWRLCAARTLGVKKRGYTDGLYDAEKVAFFGARMVAHQGGGR